MNTVTPSTSADTLLNPVRPSERISSIDCIRGFAVLGLLPANIPSWSLPHRPPTMLGEATELNVGVTVLGILFVWDAMRAIFAMLFGAGMLLMTGRAEARGSTGEIADIYFRRLLWLMLFGLVHEFILLSGQDILFSYGLLGLFLYPFRKIGAKKLVLLGCIVLVVLVIPQRSMMYRDLLSKREAAAKAQTAKSEGKELSQQEEQAIKKWERMSSGGYQDSEAAEKAIEKHRLGYWSHVTAMASDRKFSVPYGFGLMTWDQLGPMFLGMGFFKLGLFSGKWSLRFFVAMTVLCYGIALSYRGIYAARMVENGFSEAQFTAWYLQGHFSMSCWQVSRICLAMGHIGAILIICKLGLLQRLMSALSSAGRLALTNYLAQTVACTFIFYGFGLGLYGRLEPYQVYIVCMCIWVAQLLGSSLWLRYFQFGPCEWLWRSLTYWKRQPILAASVGTSTEEG